MRRIAEEVPIDTELSHPRAQRMGIDLEQAGGPGRAFDPALAANEGGLDVEGHRAVEGRERGVDFGRISATRRAGI